MGWGMAGKQLTIPQIQGWRETKLPHFGTGRPYDWKLEVHLEGVNFD
jgi:hypothetical protein